MSTATIEPEKAEDDGWETIDPMDDSVDHNGNPIKGDDLGAEAPTSDYTKREQEHYAAIVALNARVEAAHNEWTFAKEEAKGRKTIYDARAGELVDLIKRGPDPQKTLEFTEGEPDDEGSLELFSPDGAEWELRPIADLGMSDALTRKLDDGGIQTLGELSNFWRAERKLTELSGIGPEKADTIAEVWRKYAEAHPEVYGEQAEAGESDATEQAQA